MAGFKRREEKFRAGEAGMEDRLEHIRKKARVCRVYYSRYSPRSDLMYEIEDAGDDVQWMIHEIERLREAAEKGSED
jgi:hypothetical protein